MEEPSILPTPVGEAASLIAGVSSAANDQSETRNDDEESETDSTQYAAIDAVGPEEFENRSTGSNDDHEWSLGEAVEEEDDEEDEEKDGEGEDREEEDEEEEDGKEEDLEEEERSRKR